MYLTGEAKKKAVELIREALPLVNCHDETHKTLKVYDQKKALENAKKVALMVAKPITALDSIDAVSYVHWRTVEGFIKQITEEEIFQTDIIPVLTPITPNNKYRRYVLSVKVAKKNLPTIKELINSHGFNQIEECLETKDTVYIRFDAGSKNMADTLSEKIRNANLKQKT